MKFIHTSDWQLGMPFRQLQEKAEALRRSRIDSVKQVVALAEREKAEFIIAAGDLFDDNRISQNTVEEVAGILSKCSVPVYLLPGNHDPYMQDSPYVRFPNLFDGSSVVLRSAEPMKIGVATLYPCPATSRTSNDDPTEWIPLREESGGIRIGVAHGSIGTPAPGDFPIKANTATRKQLDFLALGHWHGVKEIDPRTWYCGAPETTAFNQPNAGYALVVEIAAPNAVPKVRPIKLATFNWHELDRHVCSEAEVDALLHELDSLADRQMLLRLRVRGNLPQPQVDRIEKVKGERFFYFKSEIDVRVEDGVLEYRHPLLRGMANILVEKTGSADLEAEAARRALSYLRTFVKDAGFAEGEI